jgi:enoyl-CoA hydratase/carnithine racemase
VSEPALVSTSKAGHITTVRLERPESLNAISGALADELTSVLRTISSDTDTWVLVLTAAGEKAFCVGADLKERASFTIEQFYANRKQIRDLFATLRAVPQPVIAAVFGFALGGGFELALSCDMIVAAAGAELGLPEVRVGLLPAAGGTQLLTRRLGTSKAKELMFFGKRLTAEEGKDLGIVSAVVERGDLEATALGLAEELCKSSPPAVREVKRAVDAGFGLPLEEAVDLENDGWTVVIETEDRAEGIAAFNEKRAPVWKNR